MDVRRRTDNGLRRGREKRGESEYLNLQKKAANDIAVTVEEMLQYGSYLSLGGRDCFVQEAPESSETTILQPYNNVLEDSQFSYDFSYLPTIFLIYIQETTHIGGLFVYYIASEQSNYYIHT